MRPLRHVDRSHRLGVERSLKLGWRSVAPIVAGSLLLMSSGQSIAQQASASQFASADDGARSATAAAWRRGGVPGPASVAPPELSHWSVDTTVQHNVAGTTLQAGDRAEIAGVGYRWWASKGRADVGFGLGSIGYVVRPLRGASDGVPALASSVPSVSVGMRYRASERSAVYLDAAGAPGLNRSDAYFTKVGVEWKAAQSPLSLVHGGLGLQLDSSSRMTLQLKKGVLGIYMRSAF